MTLTFTLPSVPSVNHLYANARNGGRRKTDRYRRWQNAMGWELKAQGMHKLKGAYTVMVLAAPPQGKAKRDLDNMLKAILDLLVDVQIVEADEYPYCMGISIQWSEAIKEGVAVSLRPAGALANEVAA